MTSLCRARTPKHAWLVASLWLVLAVFLPSSAQAEPPLVPALTGSNPGSPGASDTPRITGLSDGLITSVVHWPSAAGKGAVAAKTNPGNTITIYTDSNCTGAISGIGNAAELEGAGIEVSPVAHDAITTFYATQGDGVETSPCSSGFSYRQATAAPGVPLLESVTPSSPADENTPRLIGSAEAESMVRIYTDSSCLGPPVGAGSAHVFGAAGIPVSVADNTTTTFYATASWAGFESTCSLSSITYQEYSPPPKEEPPAPTEEEAVVPPVERPAAPPGAGALPAPHLRVLPAARANDNTPLVTGTAPGAAVVKIYDNAACAGAALAKGSAAQFAAGLAVSVPDNSTNHFYGVAFNGVGEPSSCSPSPVDYVEDSIAPLTRITLGPGAKTRTRAPVFRFTDVTEEAGTSFFCKIDRRQWKACQTPWHMPKLGRALHLVSVKAIDAAGNVEKAGVKRRFRVVSRPAR